MTESGEPDVKEEPFMTKVGDSPVESEGSQPDTDAKNGEEPTIGTGTSIALGCVAATVLLVVLGLVFLIAVMILS